MTGTRDWRHIPVRAALALIIVAQMSSARSAQEGNAGAGHSAGYVRGEILIELDDGIAALVARRAAADGRLPGHVTGVAALDRVGQRFGVRDARALFSLPLGRKPQRHPSPLARFFLLRLSSDGDTFAALSEYRALREVRSAQLNYLYVPDRVPNDTLYPMQWSHQITQAEAGWDIATGNEAADPVVIAIIGEGMGLGHPDLAPNIVPGWDFFSNDADPSPGPNEVHETPVAGVAAAATDNALGVAGVCWGCRIMPLRVAFTTDTVAQAIHFAMENGARVINMSFGNYEIGKYGPDTLVEAEIEAAHAAGIVLVATAGNDGVSTPRYPGALPNVIGVAMTDQGDVRPYNSNYGTWVDVAAPGRYIWTTFLGDYSTTFGTSFAAPYVSGLAGLILSKNPGLTADEVRSMIEYTADRLTVDRFSGSGRVNVARALALDGPPTLFAVIKSPDARAMIHPGQLEVWGTALGDDYLLEYRSGSGGDWTPLQSGGLVVNGTLGLLDTSLLEGGPIDLRLTAFYAGSQDRHEITVFLASTYAVHPGWPKALAPSNADSEPASADLDGDGRQEVLLSTYGSDRNAVIYAWRHDGSPLPGWPVMASNVKVARTPAIGDIDGDGDLEVVVGSENGRVAAWHHDGLLVAGFPRQPSADVNAGDGNIFRGVVLANLDGDPALEIVAPMVTGLTHVLDGDGARLAGWPQFLGTFAWTAAAVGDLDRDGRMEIVNRKPDRLSVANHDGTPLCCWANVPLNPATYISPAIADLAPGGYPRVVDVDAYGYVSTYSSSGARTSFSPVSVPFSDSGLAIGDLDGSGLRIFVGDDTGRLYGIDPAGSVIPGWPVIVNDQVSGAPLVLDLDGDGRQDVLSASREGGIYGWDLSGRQIVGTFAPAGVSRTPAAGDLDGDGDLELIVVDQAQNITVFDLPVPFDPDRADWRVHQADPRRTGYARFRDADLTPRNLRLVASTTVSGRIDLAWDPPLNAAGVAGYDIYRDGQLLSRVGRVTSYGDPSALLQVPYRYWLIGRDAQHFLSTPSNTATLTLLDTNSPTPPDGLLASSSRYDLAYLEWNAARDDVGVNNTGVVGYEVLRDGVVVATVAAVTGYVDSGLQAHRTYRYQVRAIDGAFNLSALSGEATVTTPHQNADCDRSNDLVWAVPGEVRSLVLSADGAVGWRPPLDPGGETLAYDTLRSGFAGDFVNGALCVESDDGADLTAPDVANPGAGAIFFYLVRAENACPRGEGTLGVDSSGQPRAGRQCP